MPYKVNLVTGTIHDAEKPHAKKYNSSIYANYNTIQEARAAVMLKNKTPCACVQCRLSSAVRNEINLK